MRMLWNRPVSDIIPESDVTQPRLKQVLDTACIGSDLDGESSLYAHDGLEFPIWVTVVAKQKLVRLHTFIRIDDEPSPISDDYTADLNRNFSFVQFSQVHETIYGNMWLLFDSGLHPRQFVRTVRRFSSAFAAGLREHVWEPEAEPMPWNGGSNIVVLRRTVL